MSETQYAKTTSGPKTPNAGARTPHGAVPVLFSLKNVQPLILHGKPEGNKSPNSHPTSVHSTSTPLEPVAAAPSATAVPQAVPLLNGQQKPRVSGKPQRFQNIIAGSLVLVLAVLVIRLSIPSKNSNSNTQDLASSSPSSETQVNAFTPSVALSPASPKDNTSRTELIASRPKPESTETLPVPGSNHGLATNRSDASNVPFLLASPSPGEGLGNKPESRNEGILVGSSGGMTNPPSTLHPVAGDVFPRTMGSEGSGAFSSDQTNVARPEIGESTAANGQPNLPMNIQNTQMPEQTMHDLFELYEKSKQQSMRTVSGPNAMNSNPTGPYIPISTQRDPVMGRPGEPYPSVYGGSSNPPSLPFAGQSYPPIEKEYQPLKVPEYENSLNNGVVGPAPSNSNRYQPIRQPNLKDAPTSRPRTPYVPVMPSAGTPTGQTPPVSSGSNAFGYPPGT